MEEVKGYKQLIELGNPDFIEIKGVTYCGNSGASDLTMKNVPYHKDVCEFGEMICQETRGINCICICNYAKILKSLIVTVINSR